MRRTAVTAEICITAADTPAIFTPAVTDLEGRLGEGRQHLTWVTYGSYGSLLAFLEQSPVSSQPYST